MHRYYVHAFSAILQHKSGYGLYQVRHPFPPYATHYFLLLGLSRIVPFDLAEKLFVCLTIILFALGLRMTAKAVGPSGEWASLFVAPLLLSWAMMLGFFNYVFGISLVLLATAFWQRSRNGQRWSLLWYLLIIPVLTFTHPVPLLLLIFITGMDIAVSWFFRPAGNTGTWFRQERLRMLALVLTVAAMAYPALSIDHNPADTAKTLSETGFKLPYIRTALLLTGISPYNTRTLAILPNLYRLCLYSMLFCGLWFGYKETRKAFRARRPSLGTTLFLAMPILIVALPILPNQVNGSYLFSTRLIMVLWPASLIACSMAATPDRKQQKRLYLAAGVFAVLSILPAERFFRPVARELKVVEATPMPEHQTGLVLLGDGLPDYANFTRWLAFNPFQWGTLLPVIRHEDVALDTPWLDQKIAPLGPAPNSSLLLPDVSGTAKSKEFPPAIPGRSLPADAEASLVRRSSFLVFAGSPKEIDQKLSVQLTPEEASHFSCNRVEEWYLVCLRRADEPSR